MIEDAGDGLRLEDRGEGFEFGVAVGAANVDGEDPRQQLGPADSTGFGFCIVVNWGGSGARGFGLFRPFWNDQRADLRMGPEASGVSWLNVHGAGERSPRAFP